MTLRLLKKRRTTAPKVQAETSRKSTRSSLGQFMAKSASFAVLTGATLLVSSVSAQDADEPVRYSPPVHIQPAAWSVLEDEFPRTAPAAQPAAPPKNVARAQEINSMSQYMRMQNEAVTAAKNAQVNAAVYRKQHAQATVSQNTPPGAYVAQQQYRYPEPRQTPVQVAATNQNIQRRVNPVQTPRASAPRTTAPRQVVTSNQPQRTQQRVTAAPPKRQTQARRGIGLQDRISLAIRKTLDRSRQPNSAAMNRAQTIPATVQNGNLQQVQYQQPARADVVEMLPTLAEPTSTPVASKRLPRKARNLEYRPEPGTKNEQVIVPSFVDADSDLPSLELTSTQEPVNTKGRRPRVTSRSQPMGYVSAQKGEVSVFRNAKTQIGTTQDDSAERLRKLGDELDSRRSQSGDNELPQRPSEDSPSLLDMDDEGAADEARRARSQLDAEMDEIEDESDDFEDGDDGDDPPVFDERGCEELRSLLLDRSIRDISLDISPPSSPRRNEIGNISRSWTDPSGNVIASGTMIDLRRGYVILDSGQKLPYAKLSEADWTAIAENWLLPSVCSIGQRGTLARNWAPQTVTWHASSLCHKPLYFENVQLERYGHSHGPIMQPIRSAIHFFGSVIFLPYNTAIHPPNECRYALGYYRPGNCAPWLLDPIPFSRDAIRRQALTSVGFGFIP